MMQTYPSSAHLIPEKMKLSLYMFASPMAHRILGQIYDRFTVNLQLNLLKTATLQLS